MTLALKLLMIVLLFMGSVRLAMMKRQGLAWVLLVLMVLAASYISERLN